MSDTATVATSARSRGPSVRLRKRLLGNRGVLVGSVIVAALVLTALFAPWIAPMDPVAQSIWDKYEAPRGLWVDGKLNTTFVLGADELGRDVLSRIIAGARVSLLVGLVATGLSLVAGLVLGALAGYVGGWADTLIMRVMDLLLALPSILLALAIIAATGPSIVNAMVAIAIARVPLMARVVRGEILRVKQEQFVEAAIALGSRHARVLLLHVLRNAWAPVLVLATLGMGTAIVTEASLSFLGLGTQPPEISWGRMLAAGRDAIRHAPHVSLYPGIAITLVVLGFSLLGDGLRDVFDSRLGDAK